MEITVWIVNVGLAAPADHPTFHLLPASLAGQRRAEGANPPQRNGQEA